MTWRGQITKTSSAGRGFEHGQHRRKPFRAAVLAPANASFPLRLERLGTVVAAEAVTVCHVKCLSRKEMASLRSNKRSGWRHKTELHGLDGVENPTARERLLPSCNNTEDLLLPVGQVPGLIEWATLHPSSQRSRRTSDRRDEHLISIYYCQPSFH